MREPGTWFVRRRVGLAGGSVPGWAVGLAQSGPPVISVVGAGPLSSDDRRRPSGHAGRQAPVMTVILEQYLL